MVHKMTWFRVLRKIKNVNDKNLHENPFEISEEDMATAAPCNVIEEDEDDDIELDIM